MVSRFLLAVYSLNVFINICRTELFSTYWALLCFRLGTQVPFNVIFEILNFVDSSITHRTFKSCNFVMNERVFPMPVDTLRLFTTERTDTVDSVALSVGVRNAEADVDMSHMMGDKLSDTGTLDTTVPNITFSAPTMIMFNMTHHVTVVTKTFVTSLTLEWFVR